MIQSSLNGHGDLNILCQSLAASLRREVSFDFLGLILPDPVNDQLCLHAGGPQKPYSECAVVFPGGHGGARLWREQKSVVLSPLSKEARWRSL